MLALACPLHQLSRRLVPLLLCIAATTQALAESRKTGQAIYAEQCAKCHGDDGRGASGVDVEPFGGANSLPELTKLITETMPEEKPEECVGEDATAVANYVFHKFYASATEAKANASRIDLARLTVAQYTNSVADLLATFQGTARVDDKRGLTGQYFGDRRFNSKERVDERIDPVVDFDFGEEKPHEKVKKVEEFSIRWEGSVIAEDTGQYEFIVETENGARLWLNDRDTPLIDAWVSSQGRMKEHRETIYLLGGRPYPVRLDVFKYKDKTASIRLKWKPPHKTTELIPTRNLASSRTSTTFVVQTKFPADDRVSGYERGTSVSKAWDDATTQAAIQTAGYVVDELGRLARTRSNAEDHRQKAQQFCEQFTERAFRRPLSEPQRQFFVRSHFAADIDVDEAVKRSVLLTLKSPRFLYPELGATETNDGKVDGYLIASRLALGLWDSLPDVPLINAAKGGNLAKPNQVAQQARRMLKDPRARAKLRRFFHDWLKLDEHPELAKDASLFPDFDAALQSDLRSSLDLFVEDVVWNDASDYRQLLLGREMFVNERLAKFYGTDAPDDPGFAKVPFEQEHRSGVLTHPYVMAAFAYPKLSSPIHRGIFVTRSLLGRTLKPPPQATEFKDGDFDASMTTREKVAELTKPAACMTCHTIINPLGFSLEHFDAVGRYRELEGERKVDVASPYDTVNGKTIQLSGAQSLASYIASSEHAHAAFVDHLFHQAVKQPINAFGPNVRGELTEKFAAANFNIQELLVEIMQVAAQHSKE